MLHEGLVDEWNQSKSFQKKKVDLSPLFFFADGEAAPVAFTEAERRLVLEQVLDENDALREALEQRHPRREEMPDHFLCPITNEVMEDPVVAMDGFTYERQAITTWFQRHDTSPMTRAIIPPTLVPNIDKRSQIANFGDLPA